MQKFIALKVSNLKIDDLSGLCTETVTYALGHRVGELANARLVTLDTALTAMRARMDINRKSPLTVQIEALDGQRDNIFADLRRSVKTDTQSGIPTTKAAGDTLMQVLKPFWNINTEPMASQTDQIDIFHDHYMANSDAVNAAHSLNLSPVLQNLFTCNNQLKALYAQRFDEEAVIDGPSAVSLKPPVVKAYDAFCLAIEQELDALPTPELQTVFNEMNDMRRKYVGRKPLPLTVKNTTVEPIPLQTYTNLPVTPIPVVHYNNGKETKKLVFTHDFDLAYRNNVDVGEAQCIIHGKGKYAGQYITTFHIARGV
jgi:hypothetical protein